MCQPYDVNLIPISHIGVKYSGLSKHRSDHDWLCKQFVWESCNRCVARDNLISIIFIEKYEVTNGICLPHRRKAISADMMGLTEKEARETRGAIQIQKRPFRPHTKVLTQPTSQMADSKHGWSFWGRGVACSSVSDG